LEFSALLNHSPAMPKKTEQDPGKLDPARRALFDAVSSAGANFANLSRQIGRNHAYLGQYLWRGTPRTLPEDERKKLAVLLGVNDVPLKAPSHLSVDIHTPNRAKQSLAETSLERVRSATGEPAAFGPKDVKVLGFVKAGKIGWYPDNGSTLEMTDRPPMLVGVPDAYAVYIDDRSMCPALKPGHMVWVHPFRPPRPEDFVVVQVSEEEAYIKEYVRKTDKHVICRQYNPAEELKYPISAKIHVVVGVRLVG